jgi:hypothetical protein
MTEQVMRSSLAILVLGAIALPGCSDDGGVGGNPHTLWLANDGLEIFVKLVDAQPPPF